MQVLKQRRLWAGPAAAVMAVSAAQGACAASLNTYAGGVGGITDKEVNSGCYTSGTPDALRPFFRGGEFPVGGIAACGLTGGLSQGTTASSWRVAPVKLGIPASSAAVYSGGADAVARYGVLGVSANGSFQGGVADGGPGTYDNTVAAAKFSDTLTPTSASAAAGSAGFVRYAFELHGSASAPGTPRAYFVGSTYLELLYEQSTAPGQYGWNLSLTRGSTGKINNVAPPSGWTTSSGALSGASTFYSLELPIVWGQPYDLSVGLVVTAYGDVSADFLGTARLTGVQLYDSRHRGVPDAHLLAASGTDYLAPSAVPEVAPSWLMLVGLGAVALASRRRRA